MHTCTTAYPMRRVITGEQWSEKIYNKRKVKPSPSCPIEKASTLENIDETEEEIQFKKPLKSQLEENFMMRMILEGTRHQIYK